LEDSNWHLQLQPRKLSFDAAMVAAGGPDRLPVVDCTWLLRRHFSAARNGSMAFS
jgi:hypothetical protein